MFLANLVPRSFFRMTMENIIKNANIIDQRTEQLKSELTFLRNAYIQIRMEKLRAENVQLKSQVSSALNKLTQLEKARGVKQIPVPSRNISTETFTPQPVVEAKVPEKEKTQDKKEKKKVEGEKKEKKKAEPKKPAPDTDSLPVDVGRLDLRVGKILKAEKHPDADSLYVSRIECGDPAPRTVVSGLVKFVPIEELQGRMVVVLCNLKPAKMRGVLSEAMVMCASTPEKVEVLSPPAGCSAGDPVECAGFIRQPDSILNPKKKIFETVAPDLKTNDGLEACYMGKQLSVGGKYITSATLKNVQIK